MWGQAKYHYKQTKRCAKIELEMSKTKDQKKNVGRGFSLVESLVAVAIFTILSGVIYQTSALLIKSIGIYRENTAISSLASQYMEIVHNLPYSSVGTMSGNPHGTLPDQPNVTTVTIDGAAYQIYYVVNYLDDPSDGTAFAGTDFASNDYKQVKLYIKNVSSDKTYNFLTNITPKGLENLSSGGALFIKVFDAVGQPVPNATVNIVNTTLAPSINLTRLTDAGGNWIEVGLPNSANSYHITATKTGYSTDGTYPITVDNPNPVKPDSTIANGQVTQISFSIDKLSDLSFETLNRTCTALPDIEMAVRGDKLIGNPNILKFDHSYTSDGSGQINLNNIEWDNYTPALVGSTYMVYGSSPIQQVSVLPDTSQNFTLILGPKTNNSLLSIVKDTATGNPIEGAMVTLTNSSLGLEETKITGGSVWSSNDWTGGAGQVNLTDASRYFADDGQISTDIVPTALRLLSYDQGATYVPNGALISSTFDTGATTTAYTTITWQPPSADPDTAVRFQVATTNDQATTTWGFTGPDGTAGSYYTTSGTTLNTPSARYLRYKVFLNTTNPIKTPVLTSVNLNYVAGCFTPGQVIFPGLTADTLYQIEVSADGYQTQTISDLNISGYQTLTILMTH